MWCIDIFAWQSWDGHTRSRVMARDLTTTLCNHQSPITSFAIRLRSHRGVSGFGPACRPARRRCGATGRRCHEATAWPATQCGLRCSGVHDGSIVQHPIHMPVRASLVSGVCFLFMTILTLGIVMQISRQKSSPQPRHIDTCIASHVHVRSHTHTTT